MKLCGRQVSAISVKNILSKDKRNKTLKFVVTVEDAMAILGYCRGPVDGIMVSGIGMKAIAVFVVENDPREVGRVAAFSFGNRSLPKRWMLIIPICIPFALFPPQY